MNCYQPFAIRAKEMSSSVASNWLWNLGIGYATPYLVNPSTTVINAIKAANLGVKVFLSGVGLVLNVLYIRSYPFLFIFLKESVRFLTLFFLCRTFLDTFSFLKRKDCHWNSLCSTVNLRVCLFSFFFFFCLNPMLSLC
jgi:hypothetical protein